MQETNIIQDFYKAFGSLDAERMVEFYHPEIHFEDPVFGVLKGERAKNMWRMLCLSQKGRDFEIEASDITYHKDTGSARWNALYTFGKGGRRVHNIISAHFTFKDGKISTHIDRFNLYKWSKQAFGFKGFLVGWTTFFKRKLNKTVLKRLTDFETELKQKIF